MKSYKLNENETKWGFKIKEESNKDKAFQMTTNHKSMIRNNLEKFKKKDCIQKYDEPKLT